jgi:endoglucanase
LITVQYRNSVSADKHLVFSDKTMLTALYSDYKNRFWEDETGRTVDKERNNITTSEGQSYTMLRAVWTGDRQTFDKAWSWTEKSLQREHDHLFAWKWGKDTAGKYGILTDDGGQNTASDADVDIAFALLMAAGRWEQQKYIDEARKIIPSIWEHEVITVSGRPYLASNDLEKNSGKDAVMNPSYFAPYAFREFAKLDKSHDWTALVDNSYALLEYSMDSVLDKAQTSRLPPDWFLMNQTSGALRASEDPNLSTDYSYDAMRVPWRTALDYLWNNDPRAKRLLEKMEFLGKQWGTYGKIFPAVGHDGSITSEVEVPAAYGGSLGYFAVCDRGAGQQIYDRKLKKLYDQNTNTWVHGVNYYSDNWAWFGMALFDGQLDNPANNLQYKETKET